LLNQTGHQFFSSEYLFNMMTVYSTLLVAVLKEIQLFLQTMHL